MRSRLAQQSVIGFLLLAGIAAVVIFYFGRGQVIAGDDLFYAQRLAENSLGDTILHENVYLLALPMVLYKAMFATVGIDAYWAYRLVALILTIAGAAIFFRLSNSRVGPLASLAATALLLFLGAGAEVILTGSRLPGLVAIAAGLGAWMAIGRNQKEADRVAAALLLVAATSHPSGVAFAVGAAAFAWARGPALRWRTWWIFAPALLATVAYQLFFQIQGGPRASIFNLIGFEFDSWSALTASFSGISRLVSGPVADSAVVQSIAAVLLVFVAVTAIARRHRLSPGFWAALSALVFLIASTRLAPYGFLRNADAPRYLYPEGILFALLLIEVAAAWIPPNPRALPRLVRVSAAALFVLALTANLLTLRDAAAAFRDGSAETLGRYSAYQLDRDYVADDYTPSPLLPTAGNYFAAADSYGYAGLSRAALSASSPRVRDAADTALAGSLGLALRVPDSPGEGAPGGALPEVSASPGLSVDRSGRCLRARTEAADSGADAPLLTVKLQGGGLRLDAGTPPTQALLRRFADAPRVALPWPPGTAATIGVPRDGVTPAWQLVLAVPESLRVCALGPGA